MLLSTYLFVVLLVIFAIWLYKYATYRPENFPPGPLRLPIWGSYIFCLLENWNHPHIPIQRWAKKYGNFFGMYLGDQPCLMACDHDTVKEILTRPEFDGKPRTFTAHSRAFGKDLGIFFTEGPYWHEQRRFSLRHMRDFGFGRRFDKLENLMDDEIRNVIDYIRNGKPHSLDTDVWRGNSVLFPDMLFPCMANSILSIFGMEPVPFGTDRYRYLRKVGEGMMHLQKAQFALGMMNAAPWMRYIVPDLIGYNHLLESNKILNPFMKEVIEENKRTMIEDDIRNFWDMYFQKLEKERDQVSTFSEDQIHIASIDFMFPAVTAVTAVVVFIIQYFLHRPDFLAKVQKEIDEVVGRGRLPTLEDRKDMPYLDATVKEALRKETFVPLGITHRTVEDTKFRGYDIPRNTLVFTSLYGAHNDKKVWGDPENFRPERYIGADGKIVKKDNAMPFGAGKRLCAGETFARNSLFLLTGALAQNFNFKVPPGAKLPDIDNKTTGLVNFAKDACWVQAIPRN